MSHDARLEKSSLTNDLNHHTLRSAPVKLAVEDLLPWSEVQFAADTSYAMRIAAAPCAKMKFNDNINRSN